jgi:YebC/PmpR family DNA-binding regulatory protein
MGAQWKHKGRTEASQAKGKLISKIAKELIMAAKAGADVASNPRLRVAVEAAKKASMTRDTMERAIKRGAGLLDEKVVYEQITYEGFAPHQVPVIVECLTDNRARTVSNVRNLFRGGQLAAAGAVSWDFARLGMIEATPPAAGPDPETAAIECGAQDLEPAEEGATRFFTEPGDLDAVLHALGTAGWTVTSSVLGWRAKNPVKLDEAARHQVENFLGHLDEDDDVQTIYAGLV